MTPKKLGSSASFPSRGGRESRSEDMREYLDRMQRFYNDINAQKEQVLSRASLRTPGRCFTPLRRATDPGSPAAGDSSCSKGSRIPPPPSPSVLRSTPRRSTGAAETPGRATRSSRDGALLSQSFQSGIPRPLTYRGPVPASQAPPGSSSQLRRSATSLEWGAAAHALTPQRLVVATTGMAAPGLAQRSQNQPSSIVPRRGASANAQLDGCRSAVQESVASLQGLQAGLAEAGPACAPSPNSYFGFAQNMLEQRYNPLREGLQRLSAPGGTPSGPSQYPQQQEQQWPLVAAGAVQLAVSVVGDTTAQRSAQQDFPGDTLLVPAGPPLNTPPTARQSSSLTTRPTVAELQPCLGSLAAQPDWREEGFSQGVCHAGEEDRMLMASPVQGALLDVDDHPACYQQAPALPGPPPNFEGQEPRLAGQQSTACTPKRTPQRMASNTGAMAPYGCQTARRSGRKGLLSGCSPMAPPSAASTAALTSPDRDQQYQYGSPAVRRPHTAAGTAGTEATLAASADDASPCCPASAPPLTHLVVVNSAFSPQGGVVWGGGAVLQAWPVAHAAEEPPASGKRPGLAPLRLAFSGEAGAAPAAALPDSLGSQEHQGPEQQPELPPAHQEDTDGQAVACQRLQGSNLPLRPGEICRGSGIDGSAPGLAGLAGLAEGSCHGGAGVPAKVASPEAGAETRAERSPPGASATASLSRADQEQQDLQQGGQCVPAAVAVDVEHKELQPLNRSTDADPLAACSQLACAQSTSLAPSAAGDSGSLTSAPQPSRSGSRLAALARLKTRSLHRQATQASGAAVVEPGPPSAEVASSSLPSCSTSPATLDASAGTTGCEDSLASLKQRRRLSCSTAASPGKLACVAEAATPQGPGSASPVGGPQGSSMAPGLIAAHRPVNRRWDSAISQGSMGGSDRLCTPATDGAAGCCPGWGAEGTPEIDAAGAGTMHDAWQRGPALGPDQEAGCWPAEGVSPGEPAAPSPALQQPKPFLRRKSQSIAPRKLPDWSQVRPRTQSHLEADLLPGGSASGGGGSRCSTPRPGAAGGGLGAWSGATTPRSGRPASSAAAKQPRQPYSRPTTPQRDALGLWGIGATAPTARGTAPATAGIHSRAHKHQPATAPGTRGHATSRPAWGSGRMVPTPKSKAPATAGGRAAARTTPFSPGGPAGASRRATQQWQQQQQQQQLYHAADLVAEMQRVHGLRSGSLGPSGSYWQQAYAATASAAGVQRGPRQGEEGCSGPLDDLLGQVDRLLSQVENCI